jgi:DNA-binding NtrC family response regulator
MLDADMAQVVLIGRDWQFRALLRAQLLEEGLEVEAYESVTTAWLTLEGGERLPSLLVVDLSASEGPSHDAEQLAAWAPRIPIWIIAGRSLITEKQLAGKGFELVLFRPVDIGELVEQIKRRVEGGSRFPRC